MFSYRVDENLQLRLPEARYAEEAFALVRQNLALLKEWLPWATDNHSLENARDFIKHNLQQFADNKGFAVHIVFQNQIAGYVGHNIIDCVNQRAEMGYWLGASFHSKGLVTEASRILINHAFGELKLNRVEMHCAVENVKSCAVPNRLGFKQ